MQLYSGNALSELNMATVAKLSVYITILLLGENLVQASSRVERTARDS
jgi:hypothetical protein